MYSNTNAYLKCGIFGVSCFHSRNYNSFNEITWRLTCSHAYLSVDNLRGRGKLRSYVNVKTKISYMESMEAIITVYKSVEMSV